MLICTRPDPRERIGLTCCTIAVRSVKLDCNNRTENIWNTTDLFIIWTNIPEFSWAPEHANYMYLLINGNSLGQLGRAQAKWLGSKLIKLLKINLYLHSFYMHIHILCCCIYVYTYVLIQIGLSCPSLELSRGLELWNLVELSYDSANPGSVHPFCSLVLTPFGEVK
jgi:hypothetical protein